MSTLNMQALADHMRENGDAEEPAARDTELDLLRHVYDASRRLLRFNGIDRARTIAAADELDDAIERVKEFDGGMGRMD
jgi:hypothetical protein